MLKIEHCPMLSAHYPVYNIMSLSAKILGLITEIPVSPELDGLTKYVFNFLFFSVTRKKGVSIFPLINKTDGRMECVGNI